MLIVYDITLPCLYTDIVAMYYYYSMYYYCDIHGVSLY